MTITLLWLQLAGAALFILFASNYLAKSADVIAIKTGLGRSFAGVVLLATATSLPELGTGVSSIVVFDAPDLAAGDAFGSNIFNLMIIGLLDLYWRNGPILNRVSTTSVAVGALGILIISIAVIALFVHDATSALNSLPISPFSVVIFLVFLASMYMIYVIGRRQDSPEDESELPLYEGVSLRRSILIYALAALVVVGAAFWLAQIGDGLTHAMGWDASFVGTQFLAFSTSLPELAASFAAIRINAPELAITGVLGSNLFNMGFILLMDDIALVGQPLWGAISQVHIMTAMFAILMTAVVTVALIFHGRSRPRSFITIEATLLIGLYIVSSVFVFKLG
ncbi:MAG: sodium:calcium antiporter [Chloroflexi bacterium]|nr:sodium:calcium antiporter [Chloroflexota bacterium]MCI0840991.1 sodium:calcium antiporter [Chloroflexota bacterium]MCI0886926.1 sodium:calcium antiporter [Chloroflexota bacterium]